MFTLIAKNIFYWRLDTKILGEDWILQIYRGFSGVPAISMRLALGMELRGKDSELHILEMQPRKKVKQKIRPERRISESKPKSGELHCRVCSFSRMHSEGFSFIVWGSGGWTLVRLQLVVASFFASLIPCLWGKLQSLACFAALTSPCLWGKLQNLSRLEFLLVLWRRRVCGESCKASFVLLHSRRRVYGRSCKTSISAFPLASPCLWGKLQNIAQFATSSLCFSSTLRKLCSTK